jgi:ribonuclease HI
MLMCAKHWGLVPAELRSDVWREYRTGQEVDKRPSRAWLDAADAAIDAVAAIERARVSADASNPMQRAYVPVLAQFRAWVDPSDLVRTEYDLAREERHRTKGYEEHESYPIELELPTCAYCAGVAARCSCPSVEVGVAADGYALKACAPDAPLEVWTDGSGNTADRPGGAGVVLVRSGVVLAELSEGIALASNNAAEVWAIGRALQLVSETWGFRVKLLLCSDSEWALGAITPCSTWSLSRKKLSGRIALKARALAAKFERLELRHVEGHTGLEFNERADALAGAARRRVIERQKATAA